MIAAATQRTTRTRRREGYTLLEVTMAAGILAVGGMGIIAMQGASTQSNLVSRQMGTSLQVARTWSERLKRDALRWQAPTQASVKNSTLFLKGVPNIPAVGDSVDPSAWAAPAPTDPNESFGADYFGNDTADPAQMYYCTQVRFGWVFADESRGALAIRADVRVFSFKKGQGSIQNDYPGCVADPDAVTADNRLRTTYTSLVLRPVQ